MGPTTVRRLKAGAGCVASGLALAASMPPWGWWPLTFLGIAGFDRVLTNRPAWSRFRRGWLLGASWIIPSTVWMLDFSIAGYIAAGAILATAVALAGLAVPQGPGRWVALPGALMLAEFARSSFPFGGVPLSTLAMSQAASPLAPAARLGGELLLVLLVAAAGVAVSALAARQIGSLAVAAALIAVMLGAAAVMPRATDIGPLRVAIVQGGGPQGTRAADTDDNEPFERHLAASEEIQTPVDLVLWPENVVNVDAPLQSTTQGATLAELARRLDTVLIPGVVEPADDDHFANYAAAIDNNGVTVDRYDKVQRVPFGEYVPFRGVMNTLSGGAVERYIPNDAAAGTGPAILRTEVGKLAVVISWEVFFGRRARDGLLNGGEVVLNPTNGSSYWLTIVQSQQVASSRLRALESDRWVLQAAPTGYSALIEPDGSVVERSGISERRIIAGTIQRRSGQSPAIRFGPQPWLVLAALLVAVGWLLGRRFQAKVAAASEPPEPASVRQGATTVGNR